MQLFLNGGLCIWNDGHDIGVIGVTRDFYEWLVEGVSLQVSWCMMKIRSMVFETRKSLIFIIVSAYQEAERL